eukprot:TRINITY_DN18726_c0_g1_i2.p1 TRINITY_DN18726_c0_g1~~TRINITY_DN18726_c0_g1_i2.p1  ORF type:complete len:373 (-),score=140.52 TRINITY_DN18726_c0_g1_i2:82-1200(-)
MSKGVAFVRFDQRSQADHAIESLNQKVLPGTTRPLSIKYASNQDKSKPLAQKGNNNNNNALLASSSSPSNAVGPGLASNIAPLPPTPSIPSPSNHSINPSSSLNSAPIPPPLPNVAAPSMNYPPQTAATAFPSLYPGVNPMQLPPDYSLYGAMPNPYAPTMLQQPTNPGTTHVPNTAATHRYSPYPMYDTTNTNPYGYGAMTGGMNGGYYYPMMGGHDYSGYMMGYGMNMGGMSGGGMTSVGTGTGGMMGGGTGANGGGSTGGGGNAGGGKLYCLFVYNLPTNTDDRTMYQLFSPFGAIVNVKVIRELTSGACKGYGFVNYARYEDAVAAIATMNGNMSHSGKPLQVSFKKEPAPKANPGMMSNPYGAVDKM